ncbi:MAG TPA: cytochrome P460 family protein [Opitutus sp.]|nr:cytochrome P460 family protein [Opitutus sp.]
MKLRFFASLSVVAMVTALTAEETGALAPEVPFPDGYRAWRHVSSGVLQPMDGAANKQPKQEKIAAPHGLLANIYANDKAVEGYRTGHFPEGAMLAVDWFVLEPRGPELLQGQRKSVNVMVRDARYAATGGWGFEDFDRDSRTKRNVGANAVKMCFECHGRYAKDRGFVFSTLKP